jgi:hypothetical protein
VPTSPPLRASVLRSLTRPSFQTSLHAAARHYPALAAFDHGESLAAFLDAESPYGPPRDRVFADLIRWHRDTGAPEALAAATYASIPAALHSARWLAKRTRVTAAEAQGEVISALPLALAAFDPDSRSPHALAGLKRDLDQQLGREGRRALRQGLGDEADASETASTHDPDGAPAPSVWADRPASLAGARGLLDEPDIALGTDILDELARDGLLSPRDALLLEGLMIRGATATELGAAHGLDRTTVTRHVDRLIERVGGAFRARLRRGPRSNSARSAVADDFPEVSGPSPAARGVRR